MAPSLTEQQCEKLHMLALAPPQQYHAIINGADTQLLCALIEILTNVDLFCEPIITFLIANLIVKLETSPDLRVQLLLGQQSIIQQILAKVFQVAIETEVACAIINNYDSGHESSSS